jgi:O-methyltransferase
MSVSLTAAIARTLSWFGLEVRKAPGTGSLSIPDAEYYAPLFSPPLFSPWKGYGEFAEYRKLAQPYTMVSPDRLYVLLGLARHAVRLQGDFWECGVYKGGTARMLAEFLRRHRGPEVKLHLFDTFSGMPETDHAVDVHKKGEFADTSLEAVKKVVANPERVEFHPGWIPESFRDVPDRPIALAHVDVDIYRSVRDCCEFIYPRLQVGGVLIFDDYGFPTCPGARKAVDEFFEGKPETPIILGTGQALAIRLAL